MSSTLYYYYSFSSDKVRTWTRIDSTSKKCRKIDKIGRLEASGLVGSVEAVGSVLDLAAEDGVSSLARLSDRNLQSLLLYDATLDGLLSIVLAFILEHHILNPGRAMGMLDVVLSDALGVLLLGQRSEGDSSVCVHLALQFVARNLLDLSVGDLLTSGSHAAEELKYSSLSALELERGLDPLLAVLVSIGAVCHLVTLLLQGDRALGSRLADPVHALLLHGRVHRNLQSRRRHASSHFSSPRSIRLNDALHLERVLTNPCLGVLVDVALVAATLLNL
ncbi:hypothetical protein PMAYCL1PPCAC_28388, partial [Pristionchus mayeri]